MIRIYKQRFYILLGIIIFTILIASVFVYIIMPRGKPLIINNSDLLFEIVNIVNDGDIICRLGDRLWSQLFKDLSVTDKRFSHMGIIRINDGVITVIHAEGTTEPGRDYVKEQSLEDFIKIGRAIGIYRINNADGNQLSARALDYIGIPFDWQFDMHDESKIYCTELLYILLKNLMPGLELETSYVKELGKEIIPLEAVSSSGYFSEVYINY